MNEIELEICTDCKNEFPEDELNHEDEPLCEDCYNERGIDRMEAYNDLD